MPRSENSRDIEDQVRDLSRRDSFGQMPISNWSCLILDVADRLAPMLGRQGMELYYRVAQAWEAKETGWEGEEEAKFTAVMALYYVNLSLNEFLDVNSRFGITVELPPYPPDEPWTNVDVELLLTTGSEKVSLPLDVYIAQLTWEEILALFPLYLQIRLIYQLKDHPEYGTKNVLIAIIKSDDINVIGAVRDLRVATAKDRLQFAQDIIDNKPTSFSYTKVY